MMRAVGTAVGTVVGGLLRGVGNLFTKKQAVDDGAETEVRRVRPLSASLGGLLIFLVLYHLLIRPWLNYHFPEYGFPPLDLSLLSVLTGLTGIGM